MSPTPASSRRALLRTIGATGAASLPAGCLGAGSTGDQPTEAATDTTRRATEQSTPADQTTARGDNQTYIVRVGYDGENRFAPAELTVDPGTTVRFVWQSDGHDVVPTSQPEDADWQGHEALEATGYEYEHVFEEPGEYSYECRPHAELGMTGTIDVREAGQQPVEAEPVATDTIDVGPGGDNVFEPGTDRAAKATAGDEVSFVWQSDGHNVVPTSQPEDADWQGHEALEDDGFETSYTFEVPGRYDFECTPHAAIGMTGTLVVEE